MNYPQERGSLIAVLMLIILTVFCLVFVEPGSASYYLCLMSLIINLPFLIFLLVRLYKNTRKIQETQRVPGSSKDEP